MVPKHPVFSGFPARWVPYSRSRPLRARFHLFCTKLSGAHPLLNAEKENKTRYALTPHEFRCSLDREIAVPQFIRFRIFSVPKLKRLMYTGRANVLISEEKAAPGPGPAGTGLGCPPLCRPRAAFPSSGRSRLSERVTGPDPGRSETSVAVERVRPLPASSTAID